MTHIIKHYKKILLIILGLLVAFNLFFYFTVTSTISSEDKRKLDSLNNVIIGINNELNSLEVQIDLVDCEVKKIDSNVLKIKEEKVKIGKKYNEEITRIDNYTQDELDRFFSNRYK
jgi:peptidoglycan hydrolase CwlO-like protein